MNILEHDVYNKKIKKVYFNRLKKKLTIFDNKIKNINYPDNTKFKASKDKLVGSIEKMFTIIDGMFELLR